ncbi:hypothetical protein [Streptomyces hypolithicus]
MSAEQAATPSGTDPAGTDLLKQQVVASLMAVIGAPDDQDTARAADDAVRALEVRLAMQTAG